MKLNVMGKMVVGWRCLPPVLFYFPRHGVFCVDLVEACLLIPTGELLLSSNFGKQRQVVFVKHSS